MKGLLLKDLYSLKKYLWLFAVSIASFILLLIVSQLLPSNFEDLTLSLFASTLFITMPIIPTFVILKIYNNDMREKWFDFSSALAVSRKDYINAKYIILTALNTIYILPFFEDSRFMSLSITLAFLPFSIIMTIYSILDQKISSKFNHVISRLILFIFFAIIILPFIILVYPLDRAPLIIYSILFVADPVWLTRINILIYILSWILSAHLYAKKDL